MAIALRHLLVLRITRFFSKILAFNRWIKETIIKGLSMPHSPRWYNGQLWLLESGEGTIGTVDLKTGKYESIAQFPGFTRGLSFLGPLAFIGLSQVRESAIFSGIPLVERLEKAEERTCGVWVLNIETGETLGFCRFEEGVQEILSLIHI